MTNTVQATPPDPFVMHIEKARQHINNGEYLTATSEMECALREQSNIFIRMDYYMCLPRAYPEVWLDSHPTDKGAFIDVFKMKLDANKFDEAKELLHLYAIAAGTDYENLLKTINYKMKVVAAETTSQVGTPSNVATRIRQIEDPTNRTFMGVVYGSTASAQAAGCVYRGELLLKSNEYVAAAKEFRDAKRLKPAWRHVDALLTECEMESDLEAWLVKYPGNSYTWMRVFMRSITQDQYAKATNLLERAPPHLKDIDVFRNFLVKESARKD